MLCHVYSTENLKPAPQRSPQAGRALPLPLPVMYIHSSDVRTEVIRVIRRMNIHPRSAQDSFNMTGGHSSGIHHLQMAGQSLSLGTS